MVANVRSMEAELSVWPDDSSAGQSSDRFELFRFRFSSQRSNADDNVFQLYFDSLAEPMADEVWCTNSPVTHGRAGAFRIAICDGFLALHLELEPGESADFQALTTDAYRQLLSLIRDRGYPNLARAWNYFPGINEGEGDQERYRQFTSGRALAFEEFACSGESLPAGTAIGTAAGTPFTISAIATRDPCQMIENPRQISAYEYPPQYGPSSPSFSRAVVVRSARGKRILISGTASIVGHVSMHTDDPAGQAQETLRNLNELIGFARDRCDSSTAGKNAPDSGLPIDFVRVYVRDPIHVADIQPVLRNELPPGVNLFFLRGDICRRELLLEIEATGGI